MDFSFIKNLISRFLLWTESLGIDFSKVAVLVLILFLTVIIVGLILHIILRKKYKNRRTAFDKINSFLCIIVGVLLVCSVICIQSAPEEEAVDTIKPIVEEKEPEKTEEDFVRPLNPKATEETKPSNWKINWEVSDGEITKDFKREEKIDFGAGSKYTQLEGIVTFRGNNYRTGATYGTSVVENKTLENIWTKSVGSLGGWGGCGWTGQPQVVRWDNETKNLMNIYPEKKAKDGLIEVIYATLDGKVYFYDLEDGTPTRDAVRVGMNFKGAGALDPRGYPLLYLGSGLYNGGRSPGIHILNLIDGKIIYEQSGSDSFNRRGWGAFDSSPLVCAEADTLIWGGENGVIYTIKLNTKYDKKAGTISVDPKNVAKARYTTSRGRTLGFESSIVAVGEYLYMADNGGMLFCINANTMELIWAQDVRDDINATPAFEWGEDGKGYIYVGTSMEYGGGNSYIFKIDAESGKIVWERKYERITKDSHVSGGILGSPIIGKKGTDLEGLIIYPVGKTNYSGAGILVALDTKTGKTVWQKDMYSYAWSSPTAIYTENGGAYVLSGVAQGTLYLLDPKTGDTIHDINLAGTIESSPVVFENNIILGTRSAMHGIKIS